MAYKFALTGTKRGALKVNDNVVRALDAALGGAMPGAQVMHAIDPRRMLIRVRRPGRVERRCRVAAQRAPLPDVWPIARARSSPSARYAVGSTLLASQVAHAAVVPSFGPNR
jgi:hypothetical protein